jgi:hypothetical protein
MLAQGIRHLLDATVRPAGSGRPLVAVRRDQVRAAVPEFEALADRLLSPAPVPAQGMAQASMLLQDGGSPLYQRSTAQDRRPLPALVHQAVEGLDTLAAW